jgi:DNA primase
MEIPEIKKLLPILHVLNHYGLKPNKHNFILCPFHDDHNPSLKIYPKTNTFHCFGCGATGDQIQFIEMYEKLTKHEAILKAESLLNPIINLKPSKMELQELSRQAILSKYLQSCKAGIEHSKAAREYAQSRKLNVAKLGIGFNGARLFDTWNNILKENAAKTGLLIKNGNGSYTARFKNCLVFEIKDKEGKPVAIYGRNIERSDEKRHVLMPGKLQGFYPHYPKAETEKLIITESIIDAGPLLLIPEITREYEILATFGTNGMIEDHTEGITGLPKLKEIIFAYDGDKAGNDGVKRYAEKLLEQRPGIKISYLEIPEGEDINSLAQGHEPEIFTYLLENRQSLSLLTENNHTPIAISTTPIQPATSNQQQATRFDATHPECIVFETPLILVTIWGKIDIRHVNRLRATLHIRLKPALGEVEGRNLYAEYRDTIDLYSHNQTQRLIREAAAQLETGTDIVSRTITELTRHLEQYRQGEREKERLKYETERLKNRETFSPEQMNEGLSLLKDKNLMQRTFDYIKSIGLIGEEKNGMLLFFILLTRFFATPLHALVQGKSGSGKTYLLKKIAGLLPKLHIRITTALTENTLYHSLEGFWKHMVLLIEDLDGAYTALLPLREMMTNQSISKFTTEKDMRTGEFKQKALYVEGPMCVAGATTKDKIFEDNANRSFQIHINESQEHVEEVLEFQRRYISGLIDRKNEEFIQMLFKTAQLQLRPVEIIIPFGDELRIPQHVYKKLRTNTHYIMLIKAITFWNQHQREIKHLEDGTPYIESTVEDVEWANFLSRDVLLRKSDELSGSLRNFFETIKKTLKENNQKCFFAKPVREMLRMNPMQVNRYLNELEARGYIQKTGGNRKKGFEYEVIVWDDYEKLKAGIDIMDEILAKLKQKYGKGNDPDVLRDRD